MTDFEKEYGSSEYAQQLSEGFSYPRFKPKLEQEYRTTYNAQNTGRTRFSLIVMVAIVLFAAIVDFGTFSSDSRWIAIAITLGAMLPSLVLSYWAVGQSRFIPVMHWFLFANAMVLGIGVTVIAILTPVDNYAVQAMALVVIFAYFVSGLLLHLAVIAGLSTVTLFMVATFPSGDVVTGIQSGFVLIAANLMGIAGCYSLECMNRAAFLRASAAQELAGVDELTGMPNRRRFMKHSQALWAQGARDGAVIGIMLIDIDYFKRYNDSVGHLAGDKCLRRIGDAMLHAPRRSLDMVARFGGEEFIAIWFPGKPDAIADMVLRMHARVNGTGVLHPNSDVSKNITASVGVATALPCPGMTLRDAIRLADRALYKAKESGRNRIFHVDASSPDEFREIRADV